MSNLVEDPDGFLVPTLVARIQDGGAEQRSSFATLLALDFDFLASASYVVTSRLEVFASNNRSVDLYNTVSLRDVVVGNGADAERAVGARLPDLRHRSGAGAFDLAAHARRPRFHRTARSPPSAHSMMDAWRAAVQA